MSLQKPLAFRFMDTHLRGGVSRTVDLNGPVHIVDYGGEGPPLVLVHGLGGSHLNWMLVGPSLAADHRVIAVDLLGFGLTAPEGRSTDVHTQAGLIADLIRSEFGRPATLIGNSMGGLVALLTADHAPDVVERLVLVDPALPVADLHIPAGDTLRYLALPSLPIIGQRWTRHLRNLRSPGEQVEATLQFVSADPTRIPDEVRTAGALMETERRRMPWAMSAFGTAARSVAAVLVRRGQFDRLIHSIGAPVLVLHGEADDVVPVTGVHRLEELRPDWTVITLDGVGHVPQLEVPKAFMKIVSGWLQRTPALRPVVMRS